MTDPIVSAIERLAERVRRLEAQITYVAPTTPPPPPTPPPSPSSPTASRFISPAEMSVISGSAVLEEYNYGYAMKMPDSSDSYLGMHWVTERHIEDNTKWNFWVYYAMKTASSGNIRIGALKCHAKSGDAVQSNCGGTTSTVAVPGAAGAVGIHRIPMTFTIPKSNVLTLRIDRPAHSDALDTASGDMMLLGVEIATVT